MVASQGYYFTTGAPWHKVELDVSNLFVVDGSSFTTAAAVNPTSTIGALALRAAEGIWERRRDWG